jgi:hypothetical protein
MAFEIPESHQKENSSLLKKQEEIKKKMAAYQHERQEFENHFPHILDRLKFLSEKAPRLKKIEALTSAKLAEKEGLTIPELIKKIGEELKEFELELRNSDSGGGFYDERFALLDKIYSLHLEAVQVEVGSKTKDYLEPFRTRESLMKAFCPDATSYSNAWLTRHIQAFQEMRIQSERVVHANSFAENKEWELYDADGDWMLMPDEYALGRRFVYAERGVVEAAAELISHGYARPDMTHTTGSLALDGIGKLGGILSAQEVLKRGKRPKTGEFTSQVSKEGEVYDIMRVDRGLGFGLDSVYLSHGEKYFGYHTVHWFDEFRVTFGINEKKQKDYLERTGREKNGHVEEIEDWGSEGMRVGHAVPLEAIELIAVPMKHMKDAEQWRDTYCPQAKVLSVEALELVQSKDQVMRLVAEEEQMTPAEAWKKLLEKAPR